MVRAAILDDYQNVAMHSPTGPRSPRTSRSRSSTSLSPARTTSIKALQGFAIIVGMRERTPFPRKVIEALPDLKLLITTGARNNSFDVKALQRARHYGLRHRRRRQSRPPASPSA